MNAALARPTTRGFRNANNGTCSENTDNESTAQKKTMEWSSDNEEILVEWGDTAQCYKWLHTQSHKSFSTKHAWYTIPAIVFSTVAGTASFAQWFLEHNSQFYVSVTIGTVNLFIGVLSTVQEYLKISEKRESHRVAFLSWDKYARNIRVELAKMPIERVDAYHFIKVCRSEYDRLMETSPPISEGTIAKFLKTFAGSANSDIRAHFDILKKPDICNSIISMNETRRRWFDSQQSNQLTYISANPYSQKDPIEQKSRESWGTSSIPDTAQGFFRAGGLLRTLNTLCVPPKPPQDEAELYDARPIAVFGRDRLKIQRTVEDEISLEYGKYSAAPGSSENITIQQLTEDIICSQPPLAIHKTRQPGSNSKNAARDILREMPDDCV